MPALRSSRALLRYFSLLLLLLLALVTAGWAYACHRLQADLPATLAAYGWRLTQARVRWSGWPAAAALDLADAEISHGGLSWRLERARAAIALTHPQTLLVEGGGAQSLAAAGLPALPFTASRLEWRIDLTDIAPATLRLAGLRAALPQGPAQLDDAAIELAPGTMHLLATGLALPRLKRPFDQVEFAATAAPPPWLGATAAEWRAAGGQVRIERGGLRAGPLTANFQATIRLDAQLQPQGNGQLDVTGAAAWLDQLGSAGALNPASVTAAKAIVAILDVRSGAGPLALPLTLQEGLVTIAGIPAVRLPPLAW